MDARDWVIRSSRARVAAHSTLARHESAVFRVVLLEQLSKVLTGTPVDVQDYFSEAISCLESKLYRAGIVLAWAGHFQVLSEVCYHSNEATIRSLLSKEKFNDLAELKERITENHFLKLAKDVKFITKAKFRVLERHPI
jgi:hypothetical protein